LTGDGDGKGEGYMKGTTTAVLVLLTIAGPRLYAQETRLAPKLRVIDVMLQDDNHRCEVAWVAPDQKPVGSGDRIVWNITNQCDTYGTSKMISIGNRRPKYPKQHPGLPKNEDPLKLPDCKTTVPNDGSAHTLECDLKVRHCR
jgi:hypothetical protein